MPYRGLPVAGGRTGVFDAHRSGRQKTLGGRQTGHAPLTEINRGPFEVASDL